MNALYTPNELQIGIDVGSLNHTVAVSKKYQQAILSMGRHLTRVIWSMVQHEREYEIR